MLFALLLNGALVTTSVSAYGRWFDDELLSDVALLGLGAELIGALLLGHYTDVTDSAFFCRLGALVTSAWGLSLPIILSFDELSAFFFSLLSFALIICFYFLTEYYEYDAHAGSILALSSLFSQTALLYFCAYDLLTLLGLWELIGLISFFLVQHWAFRLASYKAGLKVFTISQVGDLPLFCFVLLAIAHFQTSDLAAILAQAPLCNLDYFVVGPTLVHVLTALTVLLSQAILLKAAQWFFYPWLLDAMEAPVPISAQLHSSTLVVVGFYLFFRFQPFFSNSPAAQTLLLCAGASTVVGASVLGAYQEDGKRLLACSTAGQLGYVLTGLALNLHREAAVLLLFCCANKALTFVWLGVFMRRRGGLSDFRFLGGPDLGWLEHAGLAAALLSFTVVPGALGWHVKALLLAGLMPGLNGNQATCLELLQLTWFFSSLYLAGLYVALFAQPSRLHRTASVRPAHKAWLQGLDASRWLRLLSGNLWCAVRYPANAGRLAGILLAALACLACATAPTMLLQVQLSAAAPLLEWVTYY